MGEIIKMKTRLRVTSVTHSDAYKSDTVTATADYGKGPEDNVFAASTPSAKFEFVVTNPNIVGMIKVSDILESVTTVIRYS